MMIKHLVLLIALSVLAILFKMHLVHVLNGLLYVHNYIAQSLNVVFSSGSIGKVIQELISLLAIPIGAGLVAALVFWLMKRSVMPHTMAVIWIIWLVLLVTIVAQGGGAMAGQAQTEAYNSEASTLLL